MTFMLSCWPLLSPGVARRQEHPHYQSILGKWWARKWNLPICNLLSALRTVVMWVNEREGCYANVSSGHLAETFQYLLGPAWKSRHRSELQIHHWDRRSCCPVFWCSFFFLVIFIRDQLNILKLLLQQYRRLDIIVLNVFWELMELTNEMFRTLNYHHC